MLADSRNLYQDFNHFLCFLKVMERVTIEKSCHNDDGFCSLIETSHDFVSAGRRCYEKVLEPLCATIDCKFIDANVSKEECAHTTRPVNVSLAFECTLSRHDLHHYFHAFGYYPTLIFSEGR